MTFLLILAIAFLLYVIERQAPGTIRSWIASVRAWAPVRRVEQRLRGLFGS